MLDPVFQKNISNFITAQFPEVYQELGPVFVDFVREYYQWMEALSGNITSPGTLYDSRRAMDYGDIDTTVDRFITHFKNKYLQNIQLTTVTNTRMLVKHSLDVFRSRGTSRGIDLLFRLVFGTGATTYLPGDDVFKLSDGVWTQPQYLEVSLRDDNEKFVGHDVVGVSSGAVAFVERYVRRRGPFKLDDVLYISALRGNFHTGELINLQVNPIDPEFCPVIIGSLSSLTVVDGSNSFNVGDIVPLVGTQQGYAAKGRVAQTSPITGLVTFTLDDGGYGYQQNSLTLVSQTVLTVANVVTGANTDKDDYFLEFDKVSQPLANLNYVNASGAFKNNDAITAWVSGIAVGTGIVLGNPVVINSTAGAIFVTQLSGNLSANIIGNAGNAVLANLSVVNGYFDLTATGNVISEGNTATIFLQSPTTKFVSGEQLLQGSNNLGTVLTFTQLAGNGQILVVNTDIPVYPGNVTGGTSGATANVGGVSFKLGIIQANNAFSNDPRAPFNSLSGTNGTVATISTGLGANFQIGTLIYPENVVLNTDYIIQYANVMLNASGYGFPAFPTANLTTVVANALTTFTATIGRIASLKGLTPGTNYSAAPLNRVFEPLTLAFQKVDWNLSLANSTGSFQTGELVTQTSTGARGLVLFSNSTFLQLDRMSLFLEFANTTNSSSFVVGANSGSVGGVSYVEAFTDDHPDDIEQEYVGLNAVVHGNTIISNGYVSSLQVVDSGFGWLDGEGGTFTSADGSRTGQFIASLGHQGQGAGFYLQKGGFLSDQKKLRDGIYWQDFSYEVRSALTFDKYSAMLKRVLHVSGTNPFGALYWSTKANSHLDSANVIITQSTSIPTGMKFNNKFNDQYVPLL